MIKFLVIGLGSMGKRRIRCLLALGIPRESIWGYDIREDRKIEAVNLYKINTIDDPVKIIINVDVVIISTPPDQHICYMDMAIKYKKPAFVEAGVILKGLEEIRDKAKKNNVFIAPSCTLIFHPLVQDIGSIIKDGRFGRITNFTYHSGQYLPDWHPWEDINDYYVSKRETGGAREIVAFELTWITKLMGFPQDIHGYFTKTSNLNCQIDDCYAISMRFKNFLGLLMVDVVSRKATRKLILNFENGQIYWDWDKNCLEIYDAIKKRDIYIYGPTGTSHQGYNKNIIEEMYIDELQSFLDALMGNGTYPNDLDSDIKVLKLLQQIEGGILP